MDGRDDDELQMKLQRDSADLISELRSLLPRFLWKDTGVVRRLVRESKTAKLIKLLEPFQEDPQLLDPHLAKIAASLVEAFLAFLAIHAYNYHDRAREASSEDIIPLPRAISKLLYTLCKIRGHKVIMQLLSPRPQQLEPMLDVFEFWNTAVDKGDHNSERSGTDMVWEERYIMLLWMSHLSQVPFNLASLTSRSHSKLRDTPMRLPKLPHECPQIAARLIVVSCGYLGVASKEREAAVQLLTRLALLEDLQRLDVHRILITWASSELRSRIDAVVVQSDHAFLGLLSFVANFVSSASTTTLDRFSSEILGIAQQTEAIEKSSAMATKTLLKLYRGLALHCTYSSNAQIETLETAIGFLMDQLAAEDTGVRFAASKGLAKIASHIDQESAMQIIVTILEELQKDVLFGSVKLGEESLLEAGTHPQARLKNKQGDFRNVDARKWHGLVLTVSHFIFQRSIPAPQLFRPVEQIVRALSFTQKNALGYSIGTNVRDAACFGIWALARKYSTTDISLASDAGNRLLQALANELVVAALLDPAGNIRRGAAAALQEMIGRHPNTIECGEGLALIQLIDYHAVASRKHAMETISISVMAISEQYWQWLLHGLLSWRGARFEDIDARQKSAAETRECAAKALSYFATVNPDAKSHRMILSVLRYEIKLLAASQSSLRHGLLWAMTRVLERIHEVEHMPATKISESVQAPTTPLPEGDLASLWEMLDVEICDPSSQAKPKGKSFGVPSPLILQASAALTEQLCKSSLCNGQDQHFGHVPLPPTGYLKPMLNNLSGSRMTRLDRIHAKLNARAIEAVLQVSSKIDPVISNSRSESREESPQLLANVFVSLCFDDLVRLKAAQRYGTLAALARAIFLVGLVAPIDAQSSNRPLSPEQKKIITLLVQETTQSSIIEGKEFALWLLCDLLESDLCTSAMLRTFSQCLNDYTIDQQKGDVGSHMRIAAIHAVSLVVRRHLAEDSTLLTDAIAKVCGLAVEKLDRVRQHAFACLYKNWAACGLTAVANPSTLKDSDASTIDYYELMLSLCVFEWPQEAIVEGLVTTAGGEYETQIRASRMALINHTARLSQSDLANFCSISIRILQKHSTNDRMLIPTLEVINFLFEAGIVERLGEEDFDWDRLLDLVRKAHTNSKNLRKLEVSTRIYGGLIQHCQAKERALTELCKMLKHPYPRIRNAAADALFLTTDAGSDLTRINWGHSVKQNASNVANLRARLGVKV